ncbi:hypothetical protein VTH06DRAFT_8123 [Thermothelomyces fergusii]
MLGQPVSHRGYSPSVFITVSYRFAPVIIPSSPVLSSPSKLARASSSNRLTRKLTVCRRPKCNACPPKVVIANKIMPKTGTRTSRSLSSKEWSPISRLPLNDTVTIPCKPPGPTLIFVRRVIADPRMADVMSVCQRELDAYTGSPPGAFSSNGYERYMMPSMWAP